MRCRFALALAGLAVLAACGPLPRPFQPDVKGDNALLELKDTTGIVVAPADRLALGASGRAADAMAAVLRDLNVPASTDAGNRHSRWLLGRAEVTPLEGDREAVETTWELLGPDGERLGQARHRAVVPGGTWADGAPEALRGAVAPAAAEIAGLVQEPSPVASELPGYPPGTRLAVEPLEADFAPARRALPRALARALRAAGLPVNERPDGDDIRVRGIVELGPETDGRQQVAVRWLLLRGGEGGSEGERELARIEQQNRVPSEVVQNGWDRLAPQIARAAVPGIAEALARSAGN